jgi:hypothetical protein
LPLPPNAREDCLRPRRRKVMSGGFNHRQRRQGRFRLRSR